MSVLAAAVVWNYVMNFTVAGLGIAFFTSKAKANKQRRGE